MKYLREQCGDGTVGMMKMALEMNNIINPGKILSKW